MLWGGSQTQQNRTRFEHAQSGGHTGTDGHTCTVGVKKGFRFDITKRNGVSIQFLLCRNGTDCPFRLNFFSPFHLMLPVLITRALGDCKGREDSKNGSQKDRANRLSASRLLLNLALYICFWDPPSTTARYSPRSTANTSRGYGHAACCHSSPL